MNVVYNFEMRVSSDKAQDFNNFTAGNTLKGEATNIALYIV